MLSDDLRKQHAEQLDSLRHMLDDINLSPLVALMDKDKNQLIAQIEKDKQELRELMDKLRSMVDS